MAVEGASLELRAGEMAALVGPNGAGKSSLFHAALGMVPHEGRVTSRARRRRVAFVPQRLDVDRDFPITVAQLVSTGRRAVSGYRVRPRRPDRSAVEGHIAAAGLAGLGRRPIGALSGGQLQRALLARALAQEPDLLLLDEPLSGVDEEVAATVMELLADRAAAGAAVLLATHDLGLVRRRFTRCLAINRVVVGDGDPRAVLAPAGLERLFSGR
ncbi:MAG: metal ABC transporter ATP-binding protein [Thermoleophilia bacterium]